MAIPSSRLETDAEALIDEVIRTGVAIEIDHNGVILSLEPSPTHWPDRLPSPSGSRVGDPDERVETDGSSL